MNAMRFIPAITMLAAILWLVGLLIFIAGCTTVVDYNPYVVEINNAAAFTVDASSCRNLALAYRTTFNPGALGAAAANGALDNATDAAVAPILLAAGAAGQFTKEGLNEIGINDGNKIRIFLHCLDKKSDDVRPRPYLVLDPKLWS